MSLQYENGLYSVEDSHTGLSQVSVWSQIEGFIGDEEARHVEIPNKLINEAAVL